MVPERPGRVGVALKVARDVKESLRLTVRFLQTCVRKETTDDEAGLVIPETRDELTYLEHVVEEEKSYYMTLVEDRLHILFSSHDQFRIHFSNKRTPR